MQSCDTLAIFKGTCRNENLFGKNSDRPLGEAQPLVYYPAAHYKKGARLKCTDLEIDQVEETYAVIGSKPFWIWGFEMGVNEHGLVIGNEAQGSRIAQEETEGLLGMDLLRLALERSKTARGALEVICALLEKYGQNANACLLYDRRYENSFMIMDREEIWILETAGREWAARRVKDCASISNCYTIESDFDLCSKNLKATAKEKGFYKDGETFSFAKSYTLPAIRQNRSVPRYRRMEQLLAESDKHSFDTLKRIFRDHFDGTLLEPRFGATAGNFYTVCMHPQNINEAKTAASLFVTYDDVLGISMRHAFATPCLSVYMPIYFTGYMPSCIKNGGEHFDEESLWWLTERLNVAVSMDEEAFGEKIRTVQRACEKILEEATEIAENKAKALIVDGKLSDAQNVLNDHMDFCAKKLTELAKELYSDIKKEYGAENFYGPCREVLEWYNSHAELKLL